MTSRDTILGSLRANRKPFPSTPPPPESYIPVTRLDSETLLARFVAEAEERFTQVSVTANPAEAVQRVIALIGADKRVLAWEDLPLPELDSALRDLQIEVVHLRARDDDRTVRLEDAETIRVGITGVDAAFATTGTMALVSAKGHGRISSLLPPVHIALLDKMRLYARLEDWFIDEGRAALKKSPSVALVTGPSSTGDIEQQSVLGAHGPGTVHVVIF